MEKEFEHRLTVVEDRSKSNTIRLDEMEKRQDNLEELTTTVKVLATKEENVERTVGEIKTDIKEMKDKPSKRQDKIIESVIVAIIGTVIGFIFGKIGM
jgi:hypothetical protein